MKIHINFFSILFFLLASCSSSSAEMPYFENFNIHFEILIPPFYTGNMNINGDRSFKITYISVGDTAYKLKAVNDTVVGKISDSEMTKLVDLCKRADVYNVNFSNREKGPIIGTIDDFPFEIEINSINGQTNKLSFSSGIIPKESKDLQTYSLTLMDTYYKWR